MKITKKLLMGSVLALGVTATAQASGMITDIRVNMSPLAPVATVNMENEFDDETLYIVGRSEETITNAIEMEYDLTEKEALDLIMFDYSEDNIPTIDARNDTIMLDTYVVGGSQTILALWVNGQYYDYWFNTSNIAEAVDAMATLAEVRESVLYDAIRAYNSPMDNNSETEVNSESETNIVVTSNNAETSWSNPVMNYQFDIYLGNGQSTIEVYKDNGQLKESYIYESDNRSEVVAQLALRYQMEVSELEARASITSDGIDDRDLENLSGRDDNLDPHEGDDYEKGQTPVAGY